MAFYLDHAASTPVRAAAVEAMVHAMTAGFGNPSGAHRMAREANRALDDSRDAVASALGAKPGEVIFTSGGTEADNLAIVGALQARPGVAVCSAIEHHAVLDPVVRSNGVVVPVTSAGQIDLEALEQALLAQTDVAVVSVMAANNETGVVQPLADVAEVIRRAAPDALFHTDAVQGMCWLDLTTLCAEADLISISSHKFGGPKGAGALVTRGNPVLGVLSLGGAQERGRRGGTQNVPGIVGMAAAISNTLDEREFQVPRVEALRDRLVDTLLASVEGAIETGDRSNKTANMAHMCFEGIESEALLFLLESADVMASAASSCASGAQDPSHVLAAMGYDRALAFGSLRLSLGYTSTEADVDAALNVIPAAVQRLRERS